jgi:hypothetical protein
MITVTTHQTPTARYATIKTDRADMTLRIDHDNTAAALRAEAQRNRQKADRLIRAAAIYDQAAATMEPQQ